MVDVDVDEDYENKDYRNNEHINYHKGNKTNNINATGICDECTLSQYVQ